MKYVVVDIETTGLSRNRHNITEIAAARYENGKKINEFQSLVNPDKKIPSFITRLTGIDNEMVKDSPKIHEIMPSFIEFLGDDPMIAHNAMFDFGFLNYNAYHHMTHSINNNVICTKKLANRLVPELPSKKLSCLCEHFNIVNVQAHRAMADVHATAEVFSNFISKLNEHGINEIDEVKRIEDMPRLKVEKIILR